MERVDGLLRAIAAGAALIGAGFLVAPVKTDVEPVPVTGPLAMEPGIARASTIADSLTEDIILYNLFSPTRTAPSRRYADRGTAPGIDDESEADPAMSGSFMPELIGTAVADKPGETKALLRLDASDPAPRLYAVGERAGGFTVVSIDAKSVVLTGPRGRIVLRLPENEENHS